MDPSLACIDPKLLQLTQLLEEDEVPSLPSSRSTPVEELYQCQPQPPKQQVKDEEGHSRSRKRRAGWMVTDEDSKAKKKKIEEDHDALQPTSVLVNDLIEALDRIKEHQELMTGVYFVKRKNPKNFGQSDWKKKLRKKKIYWDGKYPYIKAAQDCCLYECHQGPDHDTHRKEKKRKLKKNSSGMMKTKKLGCTSRISLEERVYFPDHAVQTNEDAVKFHAMKRNARNSLRDAFFKNPDSLNGQRKIQVSFSGSHNHQVGLKNDDINKPFAPKELFNHVENLIFSGCDHYQMIKNRIHEKFGQSTNLEVIKAIGQAKISLRRFCRHQEDLESYLNQWRQTNPEDLIEFRRFCFQENPDQEKSGRENPNLCFVINESEKLVALAKIFEENVGNAIEFVKCEVQECLLEENDEFAMKSGQILEWPKHLVIGLENRSQELIPRGGQGFILVYSFSQGKQWQDQPLFLDCIGGKCNLASYILQVKVGQTFYPVATILTQVDNGQTLLEEALRMLKSGTSLSSKLCIVSASLSSVQTVKKVLKDCKVVVSDKLRNSLWQEWFENNQSVKNISALKIALDNLLRSKDFDTIDLNLEKVKSHLSDFKNPEISTYWTNNWLFAYRDWIDIFSIIKTLEYNKPNVILWNDDDLFKYCTHLMKVITSNPIPKQTEHQNEMNSVKKKIADSISNLHQLSEVICLDKGQEGALVIAEMLTQTFENLLPLAPSTMNNC